MNLKKHLLNNKNKQIFLFSLLTLILLITPQCGRKKKDLFSFQTSQTKQVKINRLTLPAPQEIKITKLPDGNFLSWTPIEANIKLAEQENLEVKLIGYNVYRFLKTRFIPKKSLNEDPLTTARYFDPFLNDQYEQQCYTVRAVFMIDNRIIEGPTSQFICT